MASLAALALVLTTTLTSSSPARTDARRPLTVRFSNLKSQNGKLCVSLWQGPKGFPEDSDKAFHASCYSLRKLQSEPDGSVKVVVANVPSGDYAIAAFHDENDDDEFNTNLFGIPKEGFGFSQNPTVRFGAPSYDEVRFRRDNDDTAQAVVMKYF